jgi:hypothetical protein
MMTINQGKSHVNHMVTVAFNSAMRNARTAQSMKIIDAPHNVPI